MKNRTVFVGMHIHRFITNIEISFMSGNFTFHNFINCNNPGIADHLYSIFFEILSDKDSMHAGNRMENGVEMIHTGVIEITQKGNNGLEYKKEDGTTPDKNIPNWELSIRKQQESVLSIQVESEPDPHILIAEIIEASFGCINLLQDNAAFSLLHAFDGDIASTTVGLQRAINFELMKSSMPAKAGLKTRPLVKKLKCNPAGKAFTSFIRIGRELTVMETVWLYLLLMLFDKIQILEVADRSMHV